MRAASQQATGWFSHRAIPNWLCALDHMPHGWCCRFDAPARRTTVRKATSETRSPAMHARHTGSGSCRAVPTGHEISRPSRPDAHRKRCDRRTCRRVHHARPRGRRHHQFNEPEHRDAAQEEHRLRRIERRCEMGHDIARTGRVLGGRCKSIPSGRAMCRMPAFSSAPASTDSAVKATAVALLRERDATRLRERQEHLVLDRQAAAFRHSPSRSSVWRRDT